MKLQLMNFEGIVPRLAAQLLGQTQATKAHNCDLQHGTLRPLEAAGEVADLPDSDRLSIYYHREVDEWLSWKTDVDVRRGPIFEDQYKRLYWTGDGVPKLSVIEADGTRATWPLGVPRPGTKPAVIATAIPFSEVNVTYDFGYIYHSDPSLTVFQQGDIEIVERDNIPAWQPNTAYAVGDRVKGTTSEQVYKCTNPGTSGLLASLSPDLTQLLLYGDFAAAGIWNPVPDGLISPVFWQWIPVLDPDPSNSRRFFIPGLPPRLSTTPAETIPALYVDGTGPEGENLGRAYASYSGFSNSNDFFYGGAEMVMNALPLGLNAGWIELTFKRDRENEDKIEKAYVYTFVSKYGEEGPPSPPSPVVAINPLDYGSVSNIDTTVISYLDKRAAVQSGSRVALPSTDHSMRIGQTISISGTTNYNGSYTVHEDTIGDWVVIAETYVAETFDGTEKVSLTSPHTIVKVRLYRTLTGNAGTDYQFVDEFNIGSSTYLDKIRDGDLAEILPTLAYRLPHLRLSGLTLMPAGFFAGFYGKTLYFSEPYAPHAWPTAYAITLDYDIVALGLSENGLVIATNGIPYVATGVDPIGMAVSEIPVRQACVSKRGLTKVGGSIVYPSPDGLVAVRGGTAALITEEYYTIEDWDAVQPETMIAEVHDDRLHAFTAAGMFIFDFPEGRSALYTADETATGLYSDEFTDTLYMIQGDKIVSWRKGTSLKTMKWRSKEFHYFGRGTWSVARVVAEGYPVTLNIYANRSQVLSLVLTDATARRIPVLRDEKLWEFEVISEFEVREITVATSMREVS